ncbi:NAD-dependent succinate-semialdehyde dehydrogenase [Neobacillus niacini]|uniref:NAD-dependent succinate-semialdehyde dehydrogenase n=1 Tax=Neobacillus niacini TaxID=86668 RepID=UPI0030002FED
MSTNYLNFINGEWVSARTNQTFEVINPATGEVVGTVPLGGKEDAQDAINAAKQAFPKWAALSPFRRARYLNEIYQKMISRKEELAQIITAENGKPLDEAIGEVLYAASFVQWYAEEAKRVYGDTIPSSSDRKRLFTIKQPIGVVGAITPWNFPSAMITRKIAPALAAGCTVVIKPAEQTPLSAVAIFKIFEEVSLPRGVVNLVCGDPIEVGTELSTHINVSKVTFTGSTEVGKIIYRNASDTVKRISLELGGHAPFIVFEDANLKNAAKALLSSKYLNAGQTCICTNRVYVQESVIDEFTKIFINETQKLSVGYGIDEGVNVGPLIDMQAIAKVSNHVDDAVSKGAKLMIGGKQLTEGNLKRGFFYAPTVLTNTTEDMLVNREETFGPVTSFMSFKTEEEVISRANNTQFGLAAYFFTNDVNRVTRISESLEYGIIGINDSQPSVAEAPFGGFKQSGLEKEGGYQGLEAFLETKYLSMRLS